MHEIIKGWWFYFLSICGFESYETYMMSKERGQKCRLCEYRKPGILGAKCELCGCIIEAKIRCEDCVCPDARW